MRRHVHRSLLVSLALLGCSSPEPSRDAGTAADVPADRPVEPCAARDPLRRVLFGDLHVHTALSFDAVSWGARNRPADAYRFARGEEVGLGPYDSQGRPSRRVRLARPLDFAAVTDHAEFFGETALCNDPSSPAYESSTCIDQRETTLVSALDYGIALSSQNPQRPRFCRGMSEAMCRARMRTVWDEVQRAANEANDTSSACRFTTFVAYEWTGSPDGRNLHRNVIFRGARVIPDPVSYVEAPTPQRLWSALSSQCIDAGNGCDALVIPHNSNIGGGAMFVERNDDGTPYDRAAAERRARMEPLVEMYQHKGASECIAGLRDPLASEDELCRYEQISAPPCRGPNDPPGCATRCSEGGFALGGGCVEAGDFVRGALRNGRASMRRIGADPFRMGFIGSTDTHNATPGAVDEGAWGGHAARGDDTPAARLEPQRDTRPISINLYSPGGLAAVWAEENSRAAIFDALRRREVYATSGPRITLRVFGGWSLDGDLCDRADLVPRANGAGVPMGATLPARPEGAGAPRFVVSAMQDPMSAPLQRLQVVKGWADATGTHERVYDIDGGDDGASVDVSTCALRGGRGAATRCAVWTDPSFDPAAPAFWYVRALEEPTCRWSRRLCNEQRVDCARVTPNGPLSACCDGSLPDTIQERAWSSPIWFDPR